MEYLQNHLEEQFLTKLLFVLKNTDLSQKDQYTIASILKSKYVTEYIDLHDSAVNLYNFIIEADVFQYIIRTKDKNITLSQRFLKQFQVEWMNIIKDYEERDRSNEYDFDMDLYHDW